MRYLNRSCAVLAAGLLASCANLPPMQLAAETATSKSEVTKVVERIVCEIEQSPHYTDLRGRHYTAAVSLQVTTTDSSGLTPGISFIHPLHHAPMTSQSTSVSGEVSGSAQRQYNQTFEIKIAELPEHPDRALCSDQGADNDLANDIGLRDLIDRGVTSLNGTSGVHAYSPQPHLELAGPSFGALIQFQHKTSVNGGPTWTQVHFRGPTPATGLLNWGRLSTSQLTIAFAAQPSDRQIEAAGLDALSSQAAASLLSTIILQNIGLNR